MEPERSVDSARVRVAALGALAIVTLSVGWFVLSHFALGTPAADAAGEAIGVGLSLLVLSSVVGAVRASRGKSG